MTGFRMSRGGVCSPLTETLTVSNISPVRLRNAPAAKGKKKLLVSFS